MNSQYIVEKFYNYYKVLNANGMANLYASEIQFFDPVFELLKNSEVSLMWKMVCSDAANFSLSFGTVKNLGDGYFTCPYTVSYTYQPTGRQITNKVTAHMKIEEGKIVEHSDAYSLHKYLAQAYGFAGWLLGWNRFFQQRVKNDMRRKLMNYF